MDFQDDTQLLLQYLGKNPKYHSSIFFTLHVDQRLKSVNSLVFLVLFFLVVCIFLTGRFKPIQFYCSAFSQDFINGR